MMRVIRLLVVPTPSKTLRRPPPPTSAVFVCNIGQCLEQMTVCVKISSCGGFLQLAGLMLKIIGTAV